MTRETRKYHFIIINKNKKALVDKIFDNGTGFEHFRETLPREIGKEHQSFVPTTAIAAKKDLYSRAHAKLSCDLENGTCRVYIRPSEWYTFKTDANAIKTDLMYNKKRRYVEQLYSEYIKSSESEKGMDRPASDEAWENLIQYAVNNLNDADLEKLNKKLCEHFDIELKKNVFSASKTSKRVKSSVPRGYDTTDSVIRDIQKMVEYELKTNLSYEDAAAVAKKIIKGMKNKSDLYHVPTSKLRKYVNEVKR